MQPLLIVGGVLLVAGGFMILAPTTINRLDNAKRRATLGPDSKPLKNRPTGQRIAGMIAVAAALILILIATTQH